MPNEWIDHFDLHLDLQARLSFDAELAFYRDHPEWDHARTVIDFGTGNGTYLELLAREFPSMHFVGIDQDPRLISRARERQFSPNTRYLVGNAVPEGMQADILLSRFCLMYTGGHSELGCWARTNLSQAIIQIDNADEFLSLPSSLRQFSSSLAVRKRIEADGGSSRTAATTTETYFSAAGFTRQWDQTLVVRSSRPYSREDFYRWMTVVAKLEYGNDLPVRVEEELRSWFVDSSDIRYGIRATCFTRA